MPSLSQQVLTLKLQRFLRSEFSSDFADSIALPYVDFAVSKNRVKKEKNCTKNSFACGYSCQPRFTKSGKETQCRSPLDGQQKTYADWMAAQINKAKTTSSNQEQVKAESSQLQQKQPAKQVDAVKQPQPEQKRESASFEQLGNNRKVFNEKLKEWKPLINQVSAHTNVGIARETIKKLQDEVEKIKASSESKFRVLDTAIFPPKMVMASKENALKIKQQEISAQNKELKAALKKVSTETDADFERLSAATTIYTDMKESIADKKNSVGGVIDSNGKMRAAYTYRESDDKQSLYLDYLVTSPETFIKGADRVKGAGTEAIKQMIQHSINAGKNGAISLMALDDAIPFYKKLGFEGDTEILLLNASNAKKLLSKLSGGN